MVHIFHFLQTGTVFKIVNPFSWIFNAISCKKSCLISKPFLLNPDWPIQISRAPAYARKWFVNFMVHGSPQMKTSCTRSQNESELSQLLSAESRLSSTSYAFLLKIKYREIVFNKLCYVQLVVWSAVWWNLGRFPFGKKAFHLPQFKSNLVTENWMCRLEIREIRKYRSSKFPKI